MESKLNMKTLLTADLRKIFKKGKAIYILLAIAAILPIISTLFIALVLHISRMAETDTSDLTFLFNVTSLYISSFSLLNNLGLGLLITLTIVASGDFSQGTIRNKLIAGHKREHVFFSALLTNLLFVFIIIFVHSSLFYLFASILVGFSAEVFLNVLKFGFIGFSASIAIYTLLTVIMFRFKNAWAPILVIMGTLIGLSVINMVVNIVLSMNEITFNPLPYIFPILIASDASYFFDDASYFFDPAKFNDFWIFTLVNLAYIGLFSYLGYALVKKTDFN